MAEINKQFNEFNAFSGSDIQAYIGHVHVASIRSITYSITREVLPLYTFGDPNFRTVVKGKRAIAGNLVFTQFDKHAILAVVTQMNAFRNGANQNTYTLSDLNSFRSKLPFASDTIFAGNSVGGANNTAGINNDLNKAISAEVQNTYDLVAKRVFKFADQVPPLDITISFTNESGASAYWGITGCVLVNEGGGYDLDQMMSEVAFTFIARSVVPLDSLIDPTTVSSTNSFA